MSIEKFLKQRAVNIAVGGNYTLANWYDRHGKPRSFASRTSRVSPFRMMVDVPVVGKLGDHITSYFPDFGKLEGFISDTISGGFLLELDMLRSKRQKMADKLTWLEKKQSDRSITDLRKDARVIPASPHSTLTFADGATHGCFVIDMSVSGVAVSADVQPQIGTPLAVGACVGHVIGILPNGSRLSSSNRRTETISIGSLCDPQCRGPQVQTLRPCLNERAHVAARRSYSVAARAMRAVAPPRYPAPNGSGSW